MIQQIVNFVNQVRDEDLKGLQTAYKGLHVRLRIDKAADGQQSLIEANAELSYWNGKTEMDDLVDWSVSVVHNSWMIGTNKCLDLPVKGIHSASPYCVAMKRDSLPGGDKYKKDKLKILDRFERYFANALEYVKEEKRPELDLWVRFFTDKGRLEQFLKVNDGLYGQLSNGEYVIFYLDRKLEDYKEVHQKYLKSRLYNTNEYDIPHPEVEGETMGTSNFFSNYNSKKPYLEHKTATFNINGRISGEDAFALYRFQQLLNYRVFPTPLPLFVSDLEAEGLQQSFNKIAQLKFDGKNRSSHTEVMKELLSRRNKVGIGNYYLLYHMAGAIVDFDFVPKFEYELRNEDGRAWQIESLFFNEEAPKNLQNVFDFQDRILPIIFNNALVVTRKDNSPIYNWFSDPSTKDSATLQILYVYRKAFYDFIYKSKREAVTHKLFHRLMYTTILTDIKADQVESGRNTHEVAIKKKLDIWFNLYFNFVHSPKNTNDMVNNIRELTGFSRVVVEEKSEQHIETAAQYAFMCGQVIRYLFSKVQSDKQPHNRLERFLKVKSFNQLRQELIKLYERYTHVSVTRKFEHAMSEIMTCEDERVDDDFVPLLLAGYFSRENVLFSSSQRENDLEDSNTKT